MSGLLSGLWKPNTKGLYTGPLDGLNAFNVSAPSTPTPIAVWDWTPTTYAGVDPAGTATYHWDMQDTSGDLTESIVGGGTHDLTEVSAGPNLLGQTAAGISNGSNLSGRKCIEGVSGAANSNRYHSKSTTTLNPSDGSVAIRCVFRISDGSLTALSGRHMLGTWETTSLGFFVSVSYPTGAVTLGLDDGPTYVTASASGDHADGAWHCVEAIVDWTNDEIRIRTDLDPTGATASIAAAVQATTNIDARFSVLGSEHRGSIINLQIADLYGWEGSAAESIDSTPWSEVWPYFADPLAGTAFEDDTISYTGVVSVPADDGASWYLASGDAGQFPIGYSSENVTDGAQNGFGRWTAGSIENLVVESEHLETGWTTSNVAVSAAAADLIDNALHFRAARKVTASADNGTLTSPAITVVNGQQHKLYCYIAGNGGTVSGRLIAYDETGASETASQAFSVSDGVLELVGVSFTTASTSYSIKLEIDVNGEAVNACHFVLVDIDANWMLQRGVPVPTYGSSATMDDTIGDMQGLASGDWPEAAGTFVSYMNLPAYGGTAILANDDGAGDNNAMSITHTTIGRLNLSNYDSAGSQPTGSPAIVTTAAVSDVETSKVHAVWDSANPIDTGVYSRAYQTTGGGAGSDDGATSSWTATDAVDEITIGSASSALLLGYTEIYDAAYLPGDL